MNQKGLVYWINALCLSFIMIVGCDYRWGPVSSKGVQQSYLQILNQPERFELSHDGKFTQGKAELLSELLWSYRKQGGPLAVLDTVQLNLDLQHKALSPSLSSIEIGLKVRSLTEPKILIFERSMHTFESLLADTPYQQPQDRVVKEVLRKLGMQFALSMRTCQASPSDQYQGITQYQ